MMEETIDALIKKIGDSFRGLWKSKEVYPDGKFKEEEWSVTFTLKGDIVETPYAKTPNVALNYAIFILEGEKK